MLVTSHKGQPNFNSPFASHSAASTALQAAVRNSQVPTSDSFSHSLAQRLIARFRVSPEQWYWIHRKAAQYTSPSTPQPRTYRVNNNRRPRRNNTGQRAPQRPNNRPSQTRTTRTPQTNHVLSGELVAALIRASQHLQRPKIRLSNDLRVELSRSTTSSNSVRTAWVKRRVYRNRFDWVARIDNGNQLVERAYPSGRVPTAAEIQLVQRFDRDLAGTAGSTGRLSGNCCFCGRDLTDQRSTRVGYGPVCARHYNLTWGDTVRTNRRASTSTPAPAPAPAASPASVSVNFGRVAGTPDGSTRPDAAQQARRRANQERMRRNRENVTTRPASEARRTGLKKGRIWQSAQVKAAEACEGVSVRSLLELVPDGGVGDCSFRTIT